MPKILTEDEISTTEYDITHRGYVALKYSLTTNRVLNLLHTFREVQKERDELKEDKEELDWLLGVAVRDKNGLIKERDGLIEELKQCERMVL